MATPKTTASPYRKATIVGPVKIAVVLRYGARPGYHTEAACHYCGKIGTIWWPLTHTGRIGSHIPLYDLELDHVIPEFRGGPTTAENIVLACRRCNRSKGSKVLS